MYGNRYEIYDLALDPVKNFGKVTVDGPYSNSDTIIGLLVGHAAKLPNPSTDGPFNLVWWDNTLYSDPSDDPNVEVVRCTGVLVDSLTVTRGQEGISASNKNTAGHTYKMILGPTKKMFTDIPTDAQARVDAHATATTNIHGLGVGVGIVGRGAGTTGQYGSTLYTTTTTLNWANGNVQYIVLAGGGQTFTFANPISGGRYMLILKQPASGGPSTVTWPADVLWPGGTAPTLTTTANSVDIITFVYDGGNSKYYGGASLNY